MGTTDIAVTGKPHSIIPQNDTERLAALHRYEILDTPPEAFFDRITRLASRLLKAPSAFISLVDKERVWYKSNFSTLEVSCVDRNDSLCSLTVINNADITVFEDTHLVQGLMESPYVSQPGGIRFYAGAPLITRDSYNIGTVCVIDSEPRVSISEEEKVLLKDLASLVVEQIELRALARKATRKHDELHANLAHNIVEPLKEQQTLLREAEQTPERTNIIRKVHATATALQENLQNLLAESVQEEEIALHPQQIAISRIARVIAAEYEPLARAKKQDLYFTVASRREFFVDPELIREALSILVSTAIKYTPKGSSIGLDIYEGDGVYKIEVSTESSVLSDQDLRKVFLKYAVLSGKATGDESTSGLELSRAKSIIELHKGMIWAEHLGKESGKKFVIAFKVD